jgi:hypothetical protein
MTSAEQAIAPAVEVREEIVLTDPRARWPLRFVMFLSDGLILWEFAPLLATTASVVVGIGIVAAAVIEWRLRHLAVVISDRGVTLNNGVWRRTIGWERVREFALWKIGGWGDARIVVRRNGWPPKQLPGVAFFGQGNPIGRALGHTLGWSSAPGGQIEQDDLVALLERERTRRSAGAPGA